MHGVCNDVINKNSTPEKIGNEIADMAILFRDYGVNDVFISAMICRRGKFLNGKVKQVIFLLKQICEENGYFFIDKNNNALQISNSRYEKKKNTQNEHIGSHFENFFTCHYSKTVWLAENLNEIKITHYEKLFSHI